MHSIVRTHVVLVAAISVLLACAGCAARQVVRISGEPIPEIVPEQGWECGGTDVTLQGAPRFQFVPPVRVFFGQVEGKVLAADPGRSWVRIRVPAHPAGTVRIRVVIGAGQDTAQEFFAAHAFEYMPRAGVTSIMPSRVNSEGATTVTIIGNGFRKDIQAAIGGQLITGFERLSSYQLFLVMPGRPPGDAAVTLINLPETPLEDRLVVPGFEYMPPQFRYRLAVTARLIDVDTARVLKGGLFEGTADLGKSPDGSRDKAFDGAAARLIDSFSQRGLPVADGRTQIVATSGVAWKHLPSTHVDAMAHFGPALARALTKAGATPLDQLEIAPPDGGEENMAFYIDPFGAGGYDALEADGSVSTVLQYRIASAGVQDIRDMQRYESEPADPALDDVGSAAALFERYRELTLTLPVQDSSSGTIVIRYPLRIAADGDLRAEDRLIEDGVVAGLSERATVLQKLGGPVVKPHWISDRVANLPNPLAYTTWDQFRGAHPRIAQVFLYRPVGSGIYGRFVDTSTGRVLWSGRVYPGSEILNGPAGAGVYEQAEALLATPRWDLRIGLRACVAVVHQRAAARNDIATAAQDALMSRLVASGITLIDPLVNVYEPSETPTGRTDLSAPPDLDPDWTAFEHAGATHVLEHVPTADVVEPVLTSWEFRLRNATTGEIVSSWVLRPPPARPRTSTHYATP